MSVLYSVVFATRCTSNHHRLALDALRHLAAPEAELWRDLFLHHHDAYLNGAKAPDAVFKDFKNHVLHVQDGFWGGAVEAAQEWYRRTVRALGERDWRHATHCAGVLSHYVVDPHQPLHTAQSEAENVIHRAVEQSFSKSYGLFQAALEADGGYPVITAPEGPDWLGTLIRDGAAAANAHYDTIVDHYDFKAGAKNPRAGLDQTLIETIAPLVGRAVAALACVLDNAIIEAGQAAPKTLPALDAAGAIGAAPVHLIAGAVEARAERAEVRAMYQEFRVAGKVRKTLPEDDRAVRALYAAEVLKTPLSNLDAQWPREIGGAHEGAARKPKAMRAPTPSPEPATTEAPAPEPDVAPNRPRLAPEDAIVDAPSIGPKTATRFEAVGLKTVADLLGAAPEDLAKRLAARHITAPVIRDWQAQAMLACAIPGLRGIDAQALTASGVRDALTLAAQTPGALVAMVEAYLRSTAGKPMARSAKPPSKEAAAAWIKAAQAQLATQKGADAAA